MVLEYARAPLCMSFRQSMLLSPHRCYWPFWSMYRYYSLVQLVGVFILLWAVTRKGRRSSTRHLASSRHGADGKPNSLKGLGHVTKGKRHRRSHRSPVKRKI